MSNETTREQYHKNVEVVYMLSRGTQLEDPHMIQVQYPSQQEAPTLKDVKTRLTALRGKGMPDSFSWSYKRNYKDNFIWCDLFEDDFILPLCGSGEYVLKALEVYDTSLQDQIQEEFHSARRTLPIQSTGAPMTPSKSTSSWQSSCAKPEEVRARDIDRHPAVSKSLFRSVSDVSLPASAVGCSMDLNQQVMVNLVSQNMTAPEMCSQDHSDVSSSGYTYTSEEITEKRRYSESTRTKNKTSSSFSFSSIDGDVYLPPPRDVAMDITELAVGPMTPTNDGEMTAFSFSPTAIPRAKRTWRNEADAKDAIFFPAPRDIGGSSSRSTINGKEDFIFGLREIPSSPAGPSLPAAGDPFFFMLKKAARLYRPQLCRKVDVIESQATHKTEELTSTKTSRHGSNSFNKAVSLEKIVMEVSGSYTQNPQEKFMKQIESLPEFLGSKESRSIPSKSFIPGGNSLAHGSRRKDLGSSRLESQPIASANEAYNTARCRGIAVVPEAALNLSSPAAAGKTHEKSTSGSKGHHLELVKGDSAKNFKVVIHPAVRNGLKVEETTNANSCKETNKDFLKLRRRSSAAKGSKEPEPEYKDSLVGDESTVKVHDQGIPLKTSSRKILSSKDSSFKLLPSAAGGPEKKVMTGINRVDNQPSREICVFDSAALHSGNKPGFKVISSNKHRAGSANTVAANIGGPKYQELTDFKSREERPLTPGLTVSTWERMLQEAAIHSQPPADMVLHECFQCGRTFKLDSLKVHLRGCHIINKPKPSHVPTRRTRMLS